MGSNLQNNDKNRKDIFIMKSTDGAAFALKKWLEERKFNNYSFTKRGMTESASMKNTGILKTLR